MAEIKLYDYIETDEWGWQSFNCIGYGNLSADHVVALIEAVPEDEEILVKINSCGGFVFDGWAIYNSLKNHKAKVTVRIDGIAASIASIIAMAGDEINIAQAAMLMIHKPTVDGFWMGSMDADQLQKEANTLNQIQAVLNEIYVSKTGLDSAVIDSMINAETWITPSEAVMLGFANSISNTVTENEKPTMPQNAFNHLFKNATPTVKAYANRTIKINNHIDMDKDKNELVKSHTETIKENTNILNWIKENFVNAFTPKKNEDKQPENNSYDLVDGGKIYCMGVLGVGTEVFTDEAMKEHPGAGDWELTDGNKITVDADGLVTEMVKSDQGEGTENVEELKNEIERLKAENEELTLAKNSLNKSLSESNEALTKIKNIKSTFTPSSERKQDLDRGNTEEKKEVSYNDLKENRKNRQNKNK